MSLLELLNSQKEEVLKKFPKLKINEINGLPVFDGEIDIIDGDNKYWESFSVEIQFSETYPGTFPILFETGGKIPRIADWHVHEDTGACCVKVLPLELIACKNGITLFSYLIDHAVPYLFNQTFRRVEGYYPSGEYGHGSVGIAEFYLEHLKTDNIEQAMKWMWQISEGLNPGRTDKCFCGKKVKYRHCHREAVKTLRLIGNDQLKSHVEKINSILRQ